MQWIETTGKTVDEARERALDQLGVAADEAEFEVLEEPRSGLFGRTRGLARVRARVMPRAPRPKNERKRRSRKASAGTGGDTVRSSSDTKRDNGNGKGSRREEKSATPRDEASQGDSPRTELPDTTVAGRETSDATSSTGGPREVMDHAEQQQVLESFLVELADRFGLRVEATSRVEDNLLTVDLSGDGLGLLVGPRLATLDAVQEVARHALQRQAAGREYAKVVVDVCGIRSRRQAALTEFVHRAADRARADSTEVVLEVMSSVDRKHVHDVVATLDDVESSSEGEDPRRRVVLRAV